MELIEKLTILADAAKYDASCASGGSKRTGRRDGVGDVRRMGICHSYAPDGRCISLLKILFTNSCMYECKYCINRASSGVERARFTVEEVVKLTLDFYKRNYIEGLFLSSGIVRSPDHTMEQLVAVARSLRRDHRFRGYVHLKTIPGAASELIAQAGLYADRLSVNVELPTVTDLRELAPEKDRPQIDLAMAGIHDRSEEFRQDRDRGFSAPAFAPAGQSTQMIVGATPTPDREILSAASELYDAHRLRRVYYSAFSPIPYADPNLPGRSPPLAREHRLYQADWLIRFYGFEAGELTTDRRPNLPLDIDPKLAWALEHLGSFPVDVNTAPRELLLRLPGVGVRNVKRILAQRRHRALRRADLLKLRIDWRRARWFLSAADYRPRPALLEREGFVSAAVREPVQGMLF